MLNTTTPHNFKYSITDSTVSIPAGVARIGAKLLSYSGGQMTFDAMLAPGGDASRYSNSILFLAPVGTSSALDMSSVRSASVASPSSLSNPELPTLSYPVGLFTLYSGDGTHFTRLESSIEPAGSAGGTQGITGVQGIQGNTGLQGETGIQGETGLGATGVQGQTGLQGAQGTQGVTGATGIQGHTGVRGPGGGPGLTGAQGATGATGAQGCTGAQPDGDIVGTSLQVTGGITGATINGTSLQVTGGITGASLNVHTIDASSNNAYGAGPTVFIHNAGTDGTALKVMTPNKSYCAADFNGSVKISSLYADATLYGDGIVFNFNNFYIDNNAPSSAAVMYFRFNNGGITPFVITKTGIIANYDATVNQNLRLSNIPTSDPGISGAVYRDGSNLCISIP